VNYDATAYSLSQFEQAYKKKNLKATLPQAGFYGLENAHHKSGRRVKFLRSIVELLTILKIAAIFPECRINFDAT